LAHTERMKSINGSLALITGGASGIGRLVAQDLASRGVRVRVWDLNRQGIEELETWAAARNLDLRGASCDVSDRAAVYRSARSLIDADGELDLLVNNAGVVSGQGLLETSDEKIEKTMAVNTMALFWVTKAFLPGMIARKSGQIVTVASAAGLIGVRGLVDYSASKFAAVGFAEALRMEHEKTGVLSTVVCPFFIDTGMFAGVASRFPLLLPVLKPAFVAKRIVRAVLRRQKRVVLPWFVRTLFLLRPFPVGFFDAVAGFFGINHSMDHFTGRKS